MSWRPATPSVSFAYDLMDRPTNIAWRAADGTLLRSFDMAYNALSMATNVTHADASRRAYAFDSLDRLVGDRQLAPDGTPFREAAYAHDLVGNRTQTTIDGATQTYTLGVGNRLATYGQNSYSHDAAGCVTRIARAGQPAMDLAWGAQYRLTAVSTNGVVVEAYGYDPLGRRAYTATATSSGSVTNWHAYVGLHCVADLDAEGNVLRSYTYGPGVDNLLAMTVHGATETNTYFALTDHLGTVQALVSFVSFECFVVESYVYDAWGNVLAVHDAHGSLLPASSLGNRFLFQCRDYSWATRLTNFRARWYDPSTGRWLSNDPIGISGGLNQYVFCGNDPVDYVDPSGLCEEWYGSGTDASIAASLAALPFTESGGTCPIRNIPVAPGREWGGVIYRKRFGDRWLYSHSRPRPALGEDNAMDFYYQPPTVDPVPAGGHLCGYYHIHPRNAFFSGNDGDVGFQKSTWDTPSGPVPLAMACAKYGPQVFVLDYRYDRYREANNPVPIWSNGPVPVPVKP